jgi:UDPglucose 6-dehydrogenase/GDP-mannose 6-dehydrogenase
MSIIAVGTPARPEGIDLQFVTSAAEKIGSELHHAAPYHVVVVKSTVVPGTTDSNVRESIESASGRKLGDFGLCMNPEFLREGLAVEDFMNPDRIIIGQADARSGQALKELYGDIVKSCGSG